MDYDLKKTLRKIDATPLSVRVRDSLKAVLLTGGSSTSAESLKRRDGGK